MPIGSGRRSARPSLEYGPSRSTTAWKSRSRSCSGGAPDACSQLERGPVTAELDLESRRKKFDARLASLHAEHRHGPDDVLGSLNYLDAAARARGRDAILDGTSVSLSRQVRSGRNARND